MAADLIIVSIVGMYSFYHGYKVRMNLEPKLTNLSPQDSRIITSNVLVNDQEFQEHLYAVNIFLVFFLFRLTVIPGPPLYSLAVQLLDLFPCRVEFIKDIQ